MSLRARLTLYFVILVVLPVTAVTAHGWHAVARSTQRQIRSEPQLARNSAAVALDARLERAHGAVAARQRGRPPAKSRRCLLGTVTAGIWMDSQELQSLARGLWTPTSPGRRGRARGQHHRRLTATDRVPAADGVRRGRLAGRQVVVSTEPLTSEGRRAGAAAGQHPGHPDHGRD